MWVTIFNETNNENIKKNKEKICKKRYPPNNQLIINISVDKKRLSK